MNGSLMTPAARAGDIMNLRSIWNDGRAALNGRWVLRHADVVGARVRVSGRPTIVNEGRMIIGQRVQLVSLIATTELVTGPDGTLEIGERCYINAGCSIAATQSVRIGARSHIGPHTMILDNDFHRIEPDRRLERPESKPIELAENVWIGARVIILPGVTVGADSCVGAGSVVTHDVPPRVFAAGVPARPIRDL